MKDRRLNMNNFRSVSAGYFEGIGPSFTGDLFMEVFDRDRTWAIHKGRYIKPVSNHFDYNLERQER